MNKLYLGGQVLIDLSDYATQNYVDTAVSNVDVTDQLTNYVLKTALDASIDAVDASIQSSDASIAAIKTTLASITGDGAETDAIINTWQEMKEFVADYTTANDLSTLIATVKSEAVSDASDDAAGKYYPKAQVYTKTESDGKFVTAEMVYNKSEINSQIEILAGSITQVNNDLSTKMDASAVSAAINSSLSALDFSEYLVADDISTFVDAAAVSSAINSSIAALDLANTYQPKGDYATSDDISTFVDAADVASAINSSIAALDLANTYETINDASNHVQGNGVMHIVKCTSTDYAALEVKAADTLYIVMD